MSEKGGRRSDTRRLLALNVRRIRLLRGFTQEAAAARAGIAVRHYQKIEAGEVNVTLDTLARVAQGLGTEVVELFSPQP
ncbi:MAG TPA: helix-turn-helix transcriptional regulator [Bacillota bacterium]|jgi:transcriptional regulator with XRE-family HTH domain